MKKKLKIIGLVVGAALVLAAGGFVFMMGPRNAWGMLRYDQRKEGALRVGDQAPDVSLMALDGVTRMPLRGHIGSRPLVIVFGSYT